MKKNCEQPFLNCTIQDRSQCYLKLLLLISTKTSSLHSPLLWISKAFSQLLDKERSYETLMLMRIAKLFLHLDCRNYLIYSISIFWKDLGKPTSNRKVTIQLIISPCKKARKLLFTANNLQIYNIIKTLSIIYGRMSCKTRFLRR